MSSCEKAAQASQSHMHGSLSQSVVLSMPYTSYALPSAELDTLSVLLLNLVQTPPASICCCHSPSVSSVSNFNERILPMQTSGFHRLLPAVEHRAHQTCLQSNHVKSAAWQVMKLPPTDDAWYRQAHDRQTPDRVTFHCFCITSCLLCMGK